MRARSLAVEHRIIGNALNEDRGVAALLRGVDIASGRNRCDWVYSIFREPLDYALLTINFH